MKVAHDIVMEFVWRVPFGKKQYWTLAWLPDRPPPQDCLDWALTGPWQACERCGVETKLTRFQTHPWREQVGHRGHVAPCGQRCLPGLDSWVVDCGPPHVSNATCQVCRVARARAVVKVK